MRQYSGQSTDCTANRNSARRGSPYARLLALALGPRPGPIRGGPAGEAIPLVRDLQAKEEESETWTVDGNCLRWSDFSAWSAAVRRANRVMWSRAVKVSPSKPAVPRMGP